MREHAGLLADALGSVKCPRGVSLSMRVAHGMFCLTIAAFPRTPDYAV